MTPLSYIRLYRVTVLHPDGVESVYVQAVSEATAETEAELKVRARGDGVPFTVSEATEYDI